MRTYTMVRPGTMLERLLEDRQCLVQSLAIFPFQHLACNVSSLGPTFPRSLLSIQCLEMYERADRRMLVITLGSTGRQEELDPSESRAIIVRTKRYGPRMKHWRRRRRERWDYNRQCLIERPTMDSCRLVSLLLSSHALSPWKNREHQTKDRFLARGSILTASCSSF